ncbi:glycosyltransferase family 2 protein [Sulfitobacter aestuarii]|uniref:Glycosyltransferase family 2 protein n=1 Tax=Sulfitobacter aestuarii TaxID=2161676 RepID=A0ABW5U2D8_9RHOB
MNDVTPPEDCLNVPARAPAAPEDPGHAPLSAARVLVAVPTLNEEGAIETCLRSLLGEDPFMAGVDIVIADGGSDDATIAIVRRLQSEFPNLDLIENRARLQSAAINAVVARCRLPHHAVLVRCDAHAVYPPGYVRAVAAGLLARPEAASLVVPMDAVGETCFQRAAAWIVDTPLGSGGSAHRGGRLSQWVDHGHHAGFRLDWFHKIGGYDESFSHNEDAEYDHRLGAAGGRIWLEADIRLDYHMRPSLSALARQYWNYGRGRARTMRKHRMRPRLRQLIPVLHVLMLILSLLLLGWHPAALAYPALYAALLMAVSLLGAFRLKSLCGLCAGPALGAMHLAWGSGFLREILTAERPRAQRAKVRT